MDMSGIFWNITYHYCIINFYKVIIISVIISICLFHIYIYARLSKSPTIYHTISYYVNIFEGFYQMDNLLTPLDLGCSEKATDKPPHRVTVGMIYPILWFIKWIIFWYLGIRCVSKTGIFMNFPFYTPPIEQQFE